MSLLSRMRQAVSPANQKTSVVESAPQNLPPNPMSHIKKEEPYTPRYFVGEGNIVLRSFMDDKRVIWFVAQDILKILDYPESTWYDPAIRNYFTSIPANLMKMKPLFFKRTVDGIDSIKSQSAYLPNDSTKSQSAEIRNDSILKDDSTKSQSAEIRNDSTSDDSTQYMVEEVFCITEKGIRSFLDLIWQASVKPILTLIDTDIVPFFRNISVVREFEWNNHTLRTTRDTDHKIWFVLKDVLNSLEYADSTCRNLSQQTKDLLPSQLDSIPIPVSGRIIYLSCIREDGLYTLLDSTVKPVATEYKEWIIKEVIPVWKNEGTLEEPKLPPKPPVKDSTPSLSITEEWNQIAPIDTTINPELSERKQLLALRAMRERTGGVNRPMWLVAGKVITLNQLVTLINSYWLDRCLTRQQFILWLKQQGFLERSYANSNVPTASAHQMKIFTSYTFVHEDPQTRESHFRADIKVTDVGVEYFTTLCVKGEQFVPKPY